MTINGQSGAGMLDMFGPQTWYVRWVGVNDDHQADSVSIEVTREKDGTTAIDLTYTARGVPVAGEGI